MSNIGEVLKNTEKVETENGNFFIRKHDRAEQLEAENAKLRKLAEGLNWHIETDGLCKDCPLGESPDSPFEVMCEQMMKELGIEVRQ